MRWHQTPSKRKRNVLQKIALAQLTAKIASPAGAWPCCEGRANVPSPSQHSSSYWQPLQTPLSRLKSIVAETITKTPSCLLNRTAPVVFVHRALIPRREAVWPLV